ncbi:MAG: ribbon-helix-helix protein, CopG family [Armatimonadetes bacterium]|nr:ribbon-helix-helix protein, CopG family [Armatimonadota bacterium]
MKTITINVSESVYEGFQEYARALDRTTSELIREAMELYWNERIRSRQSLRVLRPLSLGKVKKPFGGSRDYAGLPIGREHACLSSLDARASPRAQATS